MLQTAALRSTQPIESFEALRQEYDVLLCCCGYEPRSRFVATRTFSTATSRVALDMSAHDLFAYDANREWFLSQGFLLDGPSRSSIANALAKVHLSRSPERPIRGLIDISSMPRNVMADVVVEALARALPGDEVDFVYAFSDYVSPPTTLAPITYSRPVNSELSGSILDSSIPIALIVGLGYEPERALGCIDRIEPKEAFAFFPKGVDVRFENDVHNANKGLLDALGRDDIFAYSVANSDDILERLRSLIQGLKDNFRIITIPFGPKIFCLCSILTALEVSGRVSVWRVSGEKAEAPISREATGKISGVRVRVI